MMICELCERGVETVSRHHLDPRDKKGPKVNLCMPCQRQIHVLFTNYELSYEFNTIEKLVASSRVQKYLKWLRRTNPKDIRVRESRSVYKWRRGKHRR